MKEKTFYMIRWFMKFCLIATIILFGVFFDNYQAVWLAVLLMLFFGF